MFSPGSRDANAAPARRPWAHSAGLVIAGLAAVTLCVAVASMVILSDAPQPVEDIIVGVDHGNGNVFKPPTAEAKVQTKQSVLERKIAAAQEEDRIRKAVHLAMEKAEAQTSEIVKQAVKDAVSKAVGALDKDVGAVQKTTTMAQKIITSSATSQQVQKATSAEKDEMDHISRELSRQLGGLIDSVDPDESDSDSTSLSSSDDKQPATMPTLESMANDPKGKRLTFEQFKRIDPIGSLSQYHWLMWVQNQLHGEDANSAPAAATTTTTNSKQQATAATKTAAATKGANTAEDQMLQKEKSNAVETKKTLPLDDNSQYEGDDRDAEAKHDFRLLQRALAAKKRVSAAKKAAKKKSHIKEDAITKELHVLEKKHREEQAQAAKIMNKEKKAREDRDALAEKYLKQLKKHEIAKPKLPEWKSSSVPVSSRKNPEYVDAEKLRDLQAKMDMKMLKKGAVLVDKGNKMEAVKLSPVVVHGVDKLTTERQALERRKQQEKEAEKKRSIIADRDLKMLKMHPAIGKPFHKIVLPKSLLHPHTENRNAEAREDLKLLDKVEPHKVAKVQHVNRNTLAQKLLKNLEKTVGSTHGELSPDKAKKMAKKDMSVLGNVH